jgi:hypothetical protein
MSIAAGVTREVDITAVDVDGDALTLSIVGNPGFLSLQDITQTGDTATATCVIAPQVAHAGTAVGRIQVTDGRGGEHSTSFTVEAIAPESGNWRASPEFGDMVFAVGSQRATITDISFVFLSWPCGGVTRDGGAETSNPDGWPISRGRFTIETSYSGTGLTMTVAGRFDSDEAASGTWTADSYGTICSGEWQAVRDVGGGGYSPSLSLWMSPDYGQVDGVLGHSWRRNGTVTFEIDNGPDGSVDYQRTGTANSEGNVNFRDYEQGAPFTVAEGDIVRMYDDVTVVEYYAEYLTLDYVDLANDILSGSAREGTELDVRVFNPAYPFPGGPSLTVVADANDSWSADFGGIIDIVADSEGWVSTQGWPGKTTIGWRLPLAGT